MNIFLVYQESWVISCFEWESLRYMTLEETKLTIQNSDSFPHFSS